MASFGFYTRECLISSERMTTLLEFNINMPPWLLLLSLSTGEIHLAASEGSTQESNNASDQGTAVRLIHEQFLDAVYSPEEFIQRLMPVTSDETEPEISLSAAMSGRSRSRRRRRPAETLRRTRRQENLPCLGNEVVTSFLTQLLNANRQNLKNWEPINLGDAVNIGILDLKRGKAYGIASVFFQVSFRLLLIPISSYRY